MRNQAKVKNLIRICFGDNIATWIQAVRFWWLNQGNLLDSEIDMELIDNLVSPGSVAVDIGANSANWTRLLAKQVTRKGLVFAFEADPYYAAATKKTIRLLRLSNICFFSFGLSDKSEIQPLEIIDESGQRVSGTGRIVEKSENLENRVVLVRLESLDEVVKAYPKIQEVGFIKCDVEGYELMVFRGAKRLIEFARPVVVAEVGGSKLQGYENEELFAFFRKMRYESYVTVSKSRLRYSHQAGAIPEGERPNRIFIPEEYPLQQYFQVESEI